jgi:hypothetical protein
VFNDFRELRIVSQSQSEIDETGVFDLGHVRCSWPD